MSTPTSHTASKHTSQEPAHSADDWRFFRNFIWAAAEDNGERPECLACHNFPFSGAHAPHCMVHKLEAKFEENITAELDTGRKIAGYQRQVADLQEDKDALTKHLAGLQARIDRLAAAEAKTAAELKQALKVAEGHKELRDQIARLETKSGNLQKEKACLKSRRTHCRQRSTSWNPS